MAIELKKRWAHFTALITFAATLGLLCLGGLVTSHGVGMAVPDWPNTFGYNMFLFPISQWVGGVFYEHTHRLWASAVGFLTIILAIGLQVTETRRWMKVLGWVALVLVIAQGVLGGLRVVWQMNQIGIIHACFAQAYFVLIGLIALFTSRWWLGAAEFVAPGSVSVGWRWAVLIVSAVIYVQLLLGATMRHAHLGLAIPDYPMSYGQAIPPMDAASVARINDARLVAGEPPTTAGQIAMQFTHRLVAVVILFGIVFCADAVRRRPNTPQVIRRGVMTWLGLVGVQFVLGASTVWTNKAADVATAHVAVGALTLFTGALLVAMAWRIQSNPVRIDDNTKISDTKVA